MHGRASRTTRVILLGTAGGPDVRSRTGTAVVIDVGGTLYRVDFGIGSSVQFMRADLDPGAVRAGFVTHLHSDHIAELYTFFTANWYYQQDSVPLYGPPPDPRLDLTDGRPVIAPDAPTPGLAETLRAFQRAFAYDNNIRVRDESMPDLLAPVPGKPGLRPIELAPDLVPGARVYEDDRVRVSAALVEHPPIFPGLRVPLRDGRRQHRPLGRHDAVPRPARARTRRRPAPARGDRRRLAARLRHARRRAAGARPPPARLPHA